MVEYTDDKKKKKKAVSFGASLKFVLSLNPCNRLYMKWKNSPCHFTDNVKYLYF